ncbi:MAG: NHLP family bacteriocin export ABC transporter peptidase/permease/ATPase subunit [Planctomycetota bacterium]|nr:NHLP family bacteriocin export ABC transporter peptidase/permease/ATPase subunit [Planctomycetota bacterium]
MVRGHGWRVRTPTVLQLEAVECGAAALSIMLGYWGRLVPLLELHGPCGVSRDGSKASDMVLTARQYGMEAKGFRHDLESLKQVACPYIAHWNFNHFVVVEGFRGQKVYINDPATGPRTVSAEEFGEAFTGVVLTMSPGPDFRQGGSRPSLLMGIFSRLNHHAGSVAYGALADLLLAVPGLAGPVFAQVFVDRILVDGDWDWVRPLLAGMAAVAGLEISLRYLKESCLARLRQGLGISLTSKFLWKALRLPTQFYVHRYTGEVASRVDLNHGVAAFLTGPFAASSLQAVLMVLYGAVMFHYSRDLASIGIVLACLNALALLWIARRRTDGHIRLQQDAAKLEAVAVAGLRGMETLKASAHEDAFFTRWSGYYTNVVKSQQDLESINLNLGSLPAMLSSLATVFVLIVGGFDVMDGRLTIGMLIAFLALMRSFHEPLLKLVSLDYQLQALRVDLERLDDVLRHPLDPEVTRDAERESRGTPEAAAPSRLSGHLEVRNLTFGYGRQAAPILQDVSFEVRPGTMVALVGASGSGKSSMTRLVTGLYEPWAGEILLDGRARAEFSRVLLANSVAMVEQHICLFSGSVSDNLSLWDPSVPRDELEAACRDALALEPVLRLPGGFNAELSEGAANLSGGERQRLELARVLCQKPALLVLDEATSALDVRTERLILQNLRKRGCACLIVAHRLTTIRACDLILVLKDGRIVQRGTHASLSQDPQGEYARLIAEEEHAGAEFLA